MDTPPYAAAERRPLVRPTSAISSATWTASSRVGTSTRAAGRGACGSRRSTIGMPKARVLPDPVGAFARTSCPAMPSGTTIAWTAGGVTMFRRASTPITDAATPSWGKDVCCIGFVLLAAFRGHGQSGRDHHPRPPGKEEPEERTLTGRPYGHPCTQSTRPVAGPGGGGPGTAPGSRGQEDPPFDEGGGGISAGPGG